MVKVRIPTPLRPLTGGKGEVETHASDILSMIDSLNGQFPGLKSRICDDSGEIRRFVNIYLNEEDIRFMEGKNTLLKDGDQISIVPAIAGGAEESVLADSRAGGCNGAEESVPRARATASAGDGGRAGAMWTPGRAGRIAEADSSASGWNSKGVS